jgi:pimeloyl-ACP methyl ester carboxylesterase
MTETRDILERAPAAPLPDDATLPENLRVPVGHGIALRVLLWRAAGGPATAPAGGLAGSPTASGAPGGPTDGALAPFLLVHGLASNARLWDGVARRIRDAGHVAAAVDLRGHGRSDKPDDGYDFATISADLHVLLQALGLERPVLAGQSWGASVVLDLAVRHPGLVRGIALVDGGFEDLGAAFPTFDACWERLAPPLLAGTPVAHVERHMRRSHPDWSDEAISSTMANFDIHADGTVDLWLTRDRHRAILRAIYGQETTALHAAVRVPVLLVPAYGGGHPHAEGEGAAAPDRDAERQAHVSSAEAAFERSGVPLRVRWIAGDHDLHAHHPAELAGLLLEAVRDGLFA